MRKSLAGKGHWSLLTSPGAGMLATGGAARREYGHARFESKPFAPRISASEETLQSGDRAPFGPERARFRSPPSDDRHPSRPVVRRARARRRSGLSRGGGCWREKSFRRGRFLTLRSFDRTPSSEGPEKHEPLQGGGPETGTSLWAPVGRSPGNGSVTEAAVETRAA